SWSFDIHNEWPSEDQSGEHAPKGEKLIVKEQGVTARAGDRLRVRFNLHTIGYVAILGSGITVVDLNRFYRTPTPIGATTSQTSTECGRRLGKLEGEGITFPNCPADNTIQQTLGFGLALTPALAVLPDAGTSGGNVSGRSP